ncbi:MAG: hypothetical protein AABX51_07090, partial [Nanoarchaeota archaeon]
NMSDLVKHDILKQAVGARGVDAYVEFHSGPGIHPEGYVGSPVQVLRRLRANWNDCPVYLHERNPELRKNLTLAIADPQFHPVTIRGDWRNSVDEYQAQAEEGWFFLIDPTKPQDYENGILHALPWILEKGCGFLAFYPEKIAGRQGRPTFEKLMALIESSGRKVKKHEKVPVGWGKSERVDHILVV